MGVLDSLKSRMASWLKPPTEEVWSRSPNDPVVVSVGRSFKPEDLRGYISQASNGYLAPLQSFYEEMLARDAHLKALTDTAEDYLTEASVSVLAYPSTLRRGSAASSSEAKIAHEIAFAVDQELSRPEVRLDLAIRHLASGFWRGVAGVRVVVDPTGPRERLVSLEPLPSQRFGFDYETGALTFDPKGDNEPVPLDRFGASVILHLAETGVINPSRRGIFRPVMNFWLIRNLGLGWWARFIELYGTPFRKGTYPEGNDEVKETLIAVLKEAGNAGYAALPEGSNIEIIDTFQRITGHSPHQVMSEYAAREMSKLILGHAQAIEVQQGTGSVQGSKHGDLVAVRKTNARALQIARILRDGFVYPYVARNWGPDVALEHTPEVKIVLEQRGDLLDISKAIMNFVQAGVETITVSDFHALTGFSVPQPGEACLRPVPMPGQPTKDAVAGTDGQVAAPAAAGADAAPAVNQTIDETGVN